MRALSACATIGSVAGAPVVPVAALLVGAAAVAAGVELAGGGVFARASSAPLQAASRATAMIRRVMGIGEVVRSVRKTARAGAYG